MKKFNRERGLSLMAALMSGKYTQGLRYLKARVAPDGEFRYCCWGVACELSGVESWIADPEIQVWGFGDASAANTSFPPSEVLEWLFGPGATMEDDEVEFIVSALAHMNDAGVSFHGIADFIRYNLLERPE